MSFFCQLNKNTNCVYTYLNLKIIQTQRICTRGLCHIEEIAKKSQGLEKGFKKNLQQTCLGGIDQCIGDVETGKRIVSSSLAFTELLSL